MYVGRETVKNEAPSMKVDGAFIEGIIDGEFDSVLRDIGKAVRAREKALDVVRSVGVEVGDRVVVGEDVVPMYLRGVTGVVDEKEGSKWVWIVVDADCYVGKYGRRIRFPLSVLDSKDNA